jgi:predicted ribosome quality control (RQC) complex YloA/Tae2 family protein
MKVYDISEQEFDIWKTTLLNEDIEKWSIKKLLLQSPLIVFGKENIEHSLLELNTDNAKMNEIIKNIKKNHIIKDMCGGYIIMENDKPETYCPILYQQYKNKKIIIYDNFSKAVEEYYKMTTTTSRKVDQKEKKNIKNQIQKMQNKYDDTIKRIQFLEENIDLINTTIIYTNSDSNQDQDINKSLKEKNLDIDLKIVFENTNRVNIKNKKYKITLNKYVYIIDPKHLAYDHISIMYKENKTLMEKMKNTQNMFDHAEKEYQRNLESKKKEIIEKEKNNKTHPNINQNQDQEQDNENRQTQNIVIKRKTLWFEQFHWFISSDGLIVILGKNSDQNEMLVKRYMEKHDLYMHSDVHGSGSCIIKRNPNDKEIPYMTLEEANVFLICHTKAWVANSPDRSYWVYPDQVSKTPKTGEYVTKGSFIIIGSKNIMSMPKLELGLTIMFKEKNNDILSNKISDDTQFAIPMCAPYRLVNKNKIKVKIVPGNKSINKTIKNDILSIIKKQITSKENTFIKEIPNDDYQHVLLSNMKILN